jgi:hypothetical protein
MTVWVALLAALIIGSVLCLLILLCATCYVIVALIFVGTLSIVVHTLEFILYWMIEAPRRMWQFLRNRVRGTV